MTDLNNIALKILEKGKGILAADESTGTMTKRLEDVDVTSTPKNRLLFRETLFSSSNICLLYTSPSPRDGLLSRMPSSA